MMQQCCSVVVDVVVESLVAFSFRVPSGWSCAAGMNEVTDQGMFALAADGVGPGLEHLELTCEYCEFCVMCVDVYLCDAASQK